MANTEIRKAAADNNVFLYEIAYQLGFNDITMSKKLRRELPDTEKAKYLEAIQAAKKAKEGK